MVPSFCFVPPPRLKKVPHTASISPFSPPSTPDGSEIRPITFSCNFAPSYFSPTDDVATKLPPKQCLSIKGPLFLATAHVNWSSPPAISHPTTTSKTMFCTLRALALPRFYFPLHRARCESGKAVLPPILCLEALQRPPFQLPSSPQWQF